ncbi:hypothetical protein CROQUDRAFT_36089 [Cronartium quercuum f. sp. fusiforme G11]|uniref:Copper transport protein n=1 Tax=Cronartium quercuum f. sp. fusiforme G11 TaxID=708437 RepID=A0A9P6NX19_9BASI|nr:hypothetical protein CROQUDRAFT_36089 [Cronartium quercuum f. sp. fusiforme G11]
MSYFNASLPTTPLWFHGWKPTTTGTTFAACLGLFGLTVLVKILGAIRHQTNLAWSRPQGPDNSSLTQILDKSENNSTVVESLRPHRHQPMPWVAEHEILRGVLSALHAGLEYFLMLAVMTYNIYFFMSIVLGHFFGEVAFGRWNISHAGFGHT